MSGLSFQRTLANAKLTYLEKYKKATLEDLNTLKDSLDAKVVFLEGNSTALVTCLGQTTKVDIINPY
ncbi:MAG: hypothetical protein V1911_02735 [Candidatus Micrarchaeota archaeon]